MIIYTYTHTPRERVIPKLRDASSLSRHWEQKNLTACGSMADLVRWSTEPQRSVSNHENNQSQPQPSTSINQQYPTILNTMREPLAMNTHSVNNGQRVNRIQPLVERGCGKANSHPTGCDAQLLKPTLCFCLVQTTF